MRQAICIKAYFNSLSNQYSDFFVVGEKYEYGKNDSYGYDYVRVKSIKVRFGQERRISSALFKDHFIDVQENRNKILSQLI